jgi:hypothetical protein
VTIRDIQDFFLMFTPNLEAGGPPFVGCPQFLTKYIRSCSPYPELVTSIRNLMTRHALVTRNVDSMRVSLALLLNGMAVFCILF